MMKTLKKAIELAVLTAFIYGFMPLAVQAGAYDGSYEILENGAGKFRVEVSRAVNAPSLIIDNAESIDIDDIVFDYKISHNGAANIRGQKPGQGYRVYGPGDAHFGSVTIKLRVGKDSRELYQWWLDTSKGKNIRKNITVTSLKRDGGEARRFILIDCFPTRWEAGYLSPLSNVAVETVVAKIGRVELASSNDEAGVPPLDPGVYANIQTVANDANDPPFETWMGGALVTARSHPPGNLHYHTTTPGQKYIDTLTLRGPLTSGRKSLSAWITNTVRGKEWKRTVTIKEAYNSGSRGKIYRHMRVYRYVDSFPVRYVFPKFSASGTGNLYEEISIKPIRLELN